MAPIILIGKGRVTIPLRYKVGVYQIRVGCRLSKMNFDLNKLYHLYNRGNNRQKIFFNRDNYIFFLKKIRTHLFPHCNLFAYCLMPNHFHLLIQANEKSLELDKNDKSIFSGGLRTLLSSYTRAINIQEKRTGSLFTQNTHVKSLDSNDDYGLTCFNYIHQNPYSAKLVDKIEDWEFSSFKDYAGRRNGTLCNQIEAQKYLTMDFENFYQQSYQMIAEDKLKSIF